MTSQMMNVFDPNTLLFINTNGKDALVTAVKQQFLNMELSIKDQDWVFFVKLQ